MPAPDIDHSATATQSQRLLYLDGWRGICIIAVLLGHFSPIHFIDFGSLGVEMFFVLSGRLMADILFVEKFPLRSFYIRRFSRVWPGLLVYTAFCGLVFFQIDGFLHVSVPSIVAALTFTTNYKQMVLGQTQLLDHLWSLCVEEHSYIVLGIVAFLLRRRSIAFAKYAMLLCAILAATNGLVQSYLFSIHALGADWPDNFDIYWRSDTRCASVFFSAFFYLQMRGIGDFRYRSLFTTIVLLVGVSTFFSVVPHQVQFLLGTICLAISVSSLEMVENKYRGVLSSKFLIVFGTYSFSIYIWQQLFYKIFQEFRADGTLTPVEGLLWRPAFIFGGCALGVLSYYFIETPARRYINKRWANPSAERSSGSLAVQ